MKRENSIFEGSRLYRQAEEGSQFILDYFQQNPKPFEEVILSITNGNTKLIISSKQDCRQWLMAVRNFIRTECHDVSPYISLPILLQAITDFYYGNYPQTDAIWLGTSLKIALSFLWDNVHKGHATSSKSLSQICKIIAATGVFEQLCNLKDIFQVFGEGEVLFDGDGFFTNNEILKEAYLNIRLTFGKRGKLHRTLDDSLSALMEQPHIAIEAIQSILRGDSPANQEIFQDTLFAQIPKNDPVEFWTKLWAYLALMITSFEIRNEITNNPFGISVVQTYGIVHFSGTNGEIVQSSMLQLFWRKAWYKNKLRGFSSNINDMIVARPILRITAEKDVFITSSILVGDSINAFVESSVMRYRNKEGIALSQKVFNNYISAKFEESVCELFRKFSFIAGKVTENGSWLIEDFNIILSHKENQTIPGEIDVLAYHPISHELIIVECKVLGIPSTKEQIRNVIFKIGSLDTEGFHSKIQKKLLWMKKTDVFSFFQVSEFVGALVLDRYMPGMVDGKYVVIDYEFLHSYLEENYGCYFS